MFNGVHNRMVSYNCWNRCSVIQARLHEIQHFWNHYYISVTWISLFVGISESIYSVLRVTICAKIVLRKTLHPNEEHGRHKISDLPTGDTYNVSLIPCKSKRIRQESKAFHLKAVYSFINTLLVSDTSSGPMAFLLPLTTVAACSIADSISLLLFRQGLECKPEYSST